VTLTQPISKDQLTIEHQTAIAAAFRNLCETFQFADETDPLREVVAQVLADIAKTGISDERELYERTLKILCVPSIPFD
jgi:hypothetical protein